MSVREREGEERWIDRVCEREHEKENECKRGVVMRERLGRERETERWRRRQIEIMERLSECKRERRGKKKNRERERESRQKESEFSGVLS